ALLNIIRSSTFVMRAAINASRERQQGRISASSSFVESFIEMSESVFANGYRQTRSTPSQRIAAAV
ncbi:MAG TPA: hypothetical protein VIA18_29545, partial [Polyangia bacterium]|nr:hypothetical protein [Polyangia bacterium]